MANIHASIAGALLALTCQLPGQRLEDAEVRITYGELKQLLARGEPAAKPPAKKPALLSAHLRLSMEDGRPVIHGNFRTMAFGEETALVPLIAGDVSLASQLPEDAVLITEGEALCLASDRSGLRVLQLRLLPVLGESGFSITMPPCPSVIFETGDLPADQSVVLQTGDREETLSAGQFRPLANNGQPIGIRLLGSRETQEALSPPEPSTWTWQQQALVIPDDGTLLYQVIARASAAGGSGVEALLPMPPDAQDIAVSGDDLVSHSRVRGENRAQALSLTWKTRGVLDRQMLITYRMPLRPLDRSWKLQTPGGEDTRTRFIIASSPLLSYEAAGLSGPLMPQGIPSTLAALLKGGTCHELEAATSAELKVTPVPVAATEEGVVKQVQWAVKIEPDGSMLATGSMIIEHKGPLDFVFDSPQGMKLLSCELNGRPVSPVDLGEGKLKVALPPQGGSPSLSCSFTHAGAALDPVEGTLKLALPQTPLFIHALSWQIDLPPGYLAETHGNLTRVASTGGPPSRIILQKNLCRDERPEIHLFYQRADLNR